MRKIVLTSSFKSLVSVLALLLLIVGTSTLTTAQTGGASASGSYQLSLEDGYTKFVEFEATSLADGTATGRLTISDEAPIADQDVDGTGDPELRESATGFHISVEFDGLSVNRNTAVMSGTVRDSSVGRYIGQRVLVVVEDNGENGEVPDKLTWGVYKPLVRNWTPSDSEVKEDNGASLTWTATDAEREDDRGIPSRSDESITTQSFPLSAYSYVEFERGAGNIRVAE